MNTFQVLVVEDNKAHQELIRQALQETGVDLFFAQTLQEAEDLMKAHKGTPLEIDIAIVDLSLPDTGSVNETIRRVMRSWGDIPVDFWTSLSLDFVDKDLKEAITSSKMFSIIQKSQVLDDRFFLISHRILGLGRKRYRDAMMTTLRALAILPVFFVLFT